MRSFQGKIYVGKEAEALEIASNWKDRDRSSRWMRLGLKGEGWERQWSGDRVNTSQGRGDPLTTHER